MSKLEDLRPNSAVRGILPEALVTVVGVSWFSSQALELTDKTPAGKVAKELICRRDEPRSEFIQRGQPWRLDRDGDPFRFVSEAHRLRLAHLLDELPRNDENQETLPAPDGRWDVDDILAITEFGDADTHRVHYVRRPFQREPDFGVTSVNYDFAELLAQAEAPR